MINKTYTMKHKILLALIAAFGLLFAACSDSPTEQPEQPAPELPTPSISLILGEVTASTVELEYIVTNATEAALLCLPANQTAPTELQLLEMGTPLTPSGEKLSQKIESLTPETDYTLYAVAKNQAGEYGRIRTLSFTTLEFKEDLLFPEATHIASVSADKMSFTYAVSCDSEEDYYMHTYLEGWLFEYLLMQRYMTDGEEFEMDVFLKQCLADYGFHTQGSAEHTWCAGDPNDARAPFFATIVGGKSYYVLYAPINAAANDFLGEAEVITLMTEPAGESDNSLYIQEEALSSQSITVRMECARGIRFFFYNLFETEQVESYKGQHGIEGMKDYLYEYGYAVANTYTDSWTINPSTSYTLCVLGVDTSGDTFYQEQVYESPELIPTVSVTLRPYERELMGFHAYDTFELTVYPWNFYDEQINPAKIRHLFATRSEVEAALGSLTLAELAEDPSEEHIALLDSLLENLSEEVQAMISDYGYISSLMAELEPDTEYCYLAVFPWRDGWKVGYAVKATEPFYGGDEATDAYKAYLGEWVVVGQSSEDYYTRDSYHIRFEELVSNRSYKVFGWSKSVLGEEFPFEARFHPETGKISIESIQQLGRMVIGEYEYVIVFTGMTSAGGSITPHGGYSGVVYEGRCDGTHLSMFPAMFQYNGYDYNFVSMAYSAYYYGDFYAMDGDEYPIVNFTVDRPTTAQSAPMAKSPATVGEGRKLLSRPARLYSPAK